MGKLSRKRRNEAAIRGASDPGTFFPMQYGNGPSPIPISQDRATNSFRPLLIRDLNRVINTWRHQAMLSDARFIFGEVGGISGAVKEKASFTVGDSFKPCYLGEDKKYRAKFNRLMSDWVKTCDIRGQPFTLKKSVWLGSVQLDRDGDYFILLVKDERGEPRIQCIEAHRVASPYGEREVTEGVYKGMLFLNGIVYDAMMRPVAYNILSSETPYGVIPSTPKYNFIKAENCLHVFDPSWSSEARGIPSICYGITDIYNMKDIDLAESIAIKSHSRVSMVEYNETGRPSGAHISGMDHPAPQTGDSPLVQQIIADGLIRYFRSNTNNKLVPFSSGRPGQTWLGFMDHIGTNAYRGVGWPIEMQNISKLGSAGVRTVTSQVNRSVVERQSVLIMPYGACVLYACSVFMERGDLPFTADWYNIGFTLPLSFSIDMGRDADNRRLDVAMGIRGLPDVLGEESEGDLRSVFVDRAKTWVMRQEVADEYKVPPEALYNPSVASTAASTAFREETDEPPPPKPNRTSQTAPPMDDNPQE